MGALDLILNVKKVAFNTDKWLVEVLKTIDQEKGTAPIAHICGLRTLKGSSQMHMQRENQVRNN